MAPKRVMKATRRDDEDDELIDVGGDGAVVAPTVAPTRNTNMMRVVQDRRRRTEGAGDRSAIVNEAAEADIAASRAARRAGGHAAGAGAAVNEDGAGADEDWEDATDTDDGDYDHEDDDELSEEIIDDGDDEDSDAEGDDEDAAYAELQGEAGAMAGAAAGAAAGATKKVGFTEPEEEEGPARVWRRDQGEKLADGQGLAYSNKAYDSFFQLRTEFPCLTFQVLRDFDGEMRTKYPLTMYLACGTQAPTAAENQLVLLKISNISRTRFDEESESDDDMIGMEDGVEDDDDDEDDVEEVNDGEAIVEYRTVAHHGAVNRLRTNPAAPNIIATWSDAGHVNVFDVQAEARQLADFANWSREQAQAWRTAAKPSDALKFTSSTSAHACEGYGLGWSRVDTTRFASGDCSGRLVVWTPADGGRYTVLAAHGEAGRQGSVEEIVWSPTEASVFVAARAGGIVEVFDTRDLRRSMLRWRADPTDINVADWNPAKTSSHLLATGADSGAVAIWDLRTVGAAGTSGQALTPLQTLMFHEGSRVTSVEFSAHNESVLSVTSDDGQCTLWDLSLERDEDEERQMVGDLFGRADVGQLPDQLMFQHQGLQHPKEAHFHPQIPGMSITCDYNGLHLFKPMNWRSLMK